MWPVTTPPAGYLICNGSTFSSVTYPDLATLLGDTYGTHSGTNYYLPDFRGRSPIGTGTPSPDDGSGYAFSLGQKFGESRHTQTVAEMPSHAHIQNVTNGGTQAGGPFWANGTTIVQWSNSAGSSGVPTTYIGGGSPANVTHTILGINFIIRAVQSSDPTVSGAASYTVPVPAMTAGTWLNITHSLGTEDVGVWVKEAASKENVNVDWKVVDLNTVALRSHSDVATNFLTAVVKK
jgi:microcystin-dependent protein